MNPQIALVVNASNVLRDDQITDRLTAYQKAYDRDFFPAWEAHGAVPLKLEFMGLKDFTAGALAGVAGNGSWPFFMNRHSMEEGALGWHTQEGAKIYGRVFVGDCIHYGIDWGTDLMHEIFETGVDSNAHRSYRMADGRETSLEVCDAVEADAIGYKIDGVLISDWVYPIYFSEQIGGPYDFTKQLTGPCPALTPGGYMEIYSNGSWSQINADRVDGLLGRRAIQTVGWRRLLRHQVGAPIHSLERVYP